MSKTLRDVVVEQLGRVLVSREQETEVLLVTFLAEGHALIEGVPGVSKTLLAKSFAQAMGLEFKRVQFTPDMLPMDIVGGFVFNMKDKELEFRRGPVFTNILLADEINRAPPKVQSALLESMQESQVTVEGKTEMLPHPHMVVATQNPVEFRGVYPLPEGQLDRFMVRIVMGYLPLKTEVDITRKNIEPDDGLKVEQCVSAKEIRNAIQGVKDVKVSDEILDYTGRIADETRNDARIGLGASPRAIIQLAKCARAEAFVSGRDYVIPDDVKNMARYVFPHRLRVSQSSLLTGTRVDTTILVEEILRKVSPPR